MRTLAPLVMAVWASDSWVASLPCAFCTVNCEDVRPAIVIAWVSKGASNSTYRCEVTVSGRMTATLPWPAAVSGFSVAIAARVRSNWATEIDTVTLEVLEALELALDELVVELDEELLQAAAKRHKASAADTASPFLAT